MTFWIWISVLTLTVVGASVLIGTALNNRGRPPRQRRRPDPRDDPVTALKASGAMRHRKSNRP